MSTQTALFSHPDADVTPDLTAYDVILINSSGGKDSQAMLDYVAELATAADVTDRITVLHNPLGRVEWPGTSELAREQAEHYGVRYEERKREKGDLLQQIEERGMWPSAKARYCTSDQKRGPGRRLITELVAELNLPKGRQARVLYALGLRAQESRGRAKLTPLMENSATSGVREVTTWHPILHWTADQVWARIHASGVRYHEAYDQGMQRLSCSFCVLATAEDLVCAARLRPDLAAEYVALEERMGHQFKADLSMADVLAEAQRRARPTVGGGR
ncbi:phosphoadenosine phosphosulfate reductase family protein [Nocardiopsis sp. NPDC006139]|uniref:phosphoadenosine phosphosulfate reductase family protein n=1 Tax=Nocardiopsis sp. NPDC006139 TaxID=3154578 RepID=UPI0033BB2763